MSYHLVHCYCCKVFLIMWRRACLQMLGNVIMKASQLRKNPGTIVASQMWVHVNKLDKLHYFVYFFLNVSVFSGSSFNHKRCEEENSFNSLSFRKPMAPLAVSIKTTAVHLCKALFSINTPLSSQIHFGWKSMLFAKIAASKCLNKLWLLQKCVT